MHGRAKGTADHYWPWAVFFKILKFRQGSGPKGTMSYRKRENFHPSVGGWGLVGEAGSFEAGLGA